MSSQHEKESSPEHKLLTGLFAHFHRTPEDMARFSIVLCWWANGGRWPSNGLEDDASEYAFECSIYWTLTPDQRESVHRIAYEMEGKQEGAPDKEPNPVLREVMREFLAVPVPPIQHAGEDQEFVNAIDQMLHYAVHLADMPRGQTQATAEYLAALEFWRSTHPEPPLAANPVKGGYGISRASPRAVFSEGDEIYPYGRPAARADIQKGQAPSQLSSPASSTTSIDIEQLIRAMKARVAAIKREKESAASKNGIPNPNKAAKSFSDSNRETTSAEGSNRKLVSAPGAKSDFLAGDTAKPTSKSARRAAYEKNNKRKRDDLLSDDDDNNVTKMRKQTLRQRPTESNADTSKNSARRSSNRKGKLTEPRVPIPFDDTSSESERQEILGAVSGSTNRRLLRQLPLRASPNPEARLLRGESSSAPPETGGVAPSSSMAEQRDIITAPANPASAALPLTTVPATSAPVFKLTKKWRGPGNQPLQTASADAKAFFEKTKDNRRTDEVILRRADSNVDWTQSRKNNYKILLAHLAGRLAPVPCLSCKYGRGPYADCVIFDDLRDGKCCTNCLHNDELNCSFERGGILTTFAYGKLRKEGKLAAVANGDYDPENPTLSLRKLPRPHLNAVGQTSTTQVD